MKPRVLLLLAMLGWPLLGCQSALTPAPGMGALRIAVIAEPKAGLKSSGGAFSYDIGGSSSETGAFEKVDYTNLDEIVVWVEPAESVKSPPPLPPAALQLNPQKPASKLAAAVSVGQRLMIRNAGSAPANFYSVSDGNDFDLGIVAPGVVAQRIVKSPGLIEILSDASKDPVGQVYAAPTRWVALTHAGASVDFTDLPPGRYHIVSWHPRLPGSQATITLAPNQAANVSIKVGVNGLPKVAPP